MHDDEGCPEQGSPSTNQYGSWLWADTVRKSWGGRGGSPTKKGPTKGFPIIASGKIGGQPKWRLKKDVSTKIARSKEFEKSNLTKLNADRDKLGKEQSNGRRGSKTKNGQQYFKCFNMG